MTIEHTSDLWLQYDTDTYIVYMVQKVDDINNRYIKIHYLAENELPYKYNVETSEMEMISQEETNNEH